MKTEVPTDSEMTKLQGIVEESLSDDPAILFDQVRHMAGVIGRVNKLAADAECLLSLAKVKNLENINWSEKATARFPAFEREIILDGMVAKEALLLNRLERMSKNYSDKIVAGQSLLKAIGNEHAWRQQG